MKTHITHLYNTLYRDAQNASNLKALKIIEYRSKNYIKNAENSGISSSNKKFLLRKHKRLLKILSEKRKSIS